jgi:putative ABC transport system permease protein
MELTAVLTPAEEGGFIALNPETGTTSQGETVEEAIANTGLQDAMLTSIGAALAATLIAIVLGSLAAMAVARHRFFGRETISFVVIFIILAVMANTMAMSARERTSEYATLKALGFGPVYIETLIYGESLLIALSGGLLGIIATVPLVRGFGAVMVKLFPVFQFSPTTLAMQVGAVLVMGIVAAAVPAVRASRVRIAHGLRAIG